MAKAVEPLSIDDMCREVSVKLYACKREHHDLKQDLAPPTPTNRELSVRSNESRTLLPINRVSPSSFYFPSAPPPSPGDVLLGGHGGPLPQIGTVWVEPIQESEAETEIVEDNGKRDAPNVCFMAMSMDEKVIPTIIVNGDTASPGDAQKNVIMDKPRVSL